jgi:hypothetical protein
MMHWIDFDGTLIPDKRWKDFGSDEGWFKWTVGAPSTSPELMEILRKGNAGIMTSRRACEKEHVEFWCYQHGLKNIEVCCTYPWPVYRGLLGKEDFAYNKALVMARRSILPNGGREKAVYFDSDLPAEAAVNDYYAKIIKVCR